MKFILIFLFFLSFNFSKSQKDSALFGKWELIKLEINSTIITPNPGKYKVKITEKEFRFKLDINWCFLIDWKTVQNKIITTKQTRSCSEICCDDKNSIFYKNLNYTGKYHFLNDNSILIIENKNGVFHLKRSNWSNLN